jgi:hypothetical protein
LAELIATATEGFPRNPDHCLWTCGLLTQNPVLFGMPPATVTHEECEAFGAERCRYLVTWEDGESDADAARSELVDSLRWPNHRPRRRRDSRSPVPARSPHQPRRRDALPPQGL